MYARRAGSHWPAARAATRGAAGIPAGGHRASGGSGRGERSLSHQCGGRSDAMGGGERHGANQRSGSQTRAGGHAQAVSLPRTGISFRQWQRVHQPHRGRFAQQTVDRADQITAAAPQRQRLGGVQEWSGHPQAHRLRLHRRGTRRRPAVLLSAILQPLPEFPPPVRSAGAGDQRQRKGEETVSLVCHALGNPAPVAGRGRVLEGRPDDPGVGRSSRRQADMQAATAMQAAKRKLFASFPERRTA